MFIAVQRDANWSELCRSFLCKSDKYTIMRILHSGSCDSIFQSYFNHIIDLNIDVIGIDIRENRFTRKILCDNFFRSPGA